MNCQNQSDQTWIHVSNFLISIYYSVSKVGSIIDSYSLWLWRIILILSDHIGLFEMPQTHLICPYGSFIMVQQIKTLTPPLTESDISIQRDCDLWLWYVNMSLRFALYWRCITWFLRIEIQIFPALRHSTAICCHRVMLVRGIWNHFDVSVWTDRSKHRLRDSAHSQCCQT